MALPPLVTHPPIGRRRSRLRCWVGLVGGHRDTVAAWWRGPVHFLAGPLPKRRRGGSRVTHKGPKQCARHPMPPCKGASPRTSHGAADRTHICTPCLRCAVTPVAISLLPRGGPGTLDGISLGGLKIASKIQRERDIPSRCALFGYLAASECVDGLKIQNRLRKGMKTRETMS